MSAAVDAGEAAGQASPAPDCVFCRIVSGEIPTELVLQTGDVVAFHDIAPKADVHVLVVPRVHRPDVVALAAADGPVLTSLVAGAQRVARDLTPDGHFRLVFNTGAHAGQSVFHVHGHVMAGSGPGMAL